MAQTAPQVLWRCEGFDLNFGLIDIERGFWRGGGHTHKPKNTENGRGGRPDNGRSYRRALTAEAKREELHFLSGPRDT